MNTTHHKRGPQNRHPHMKRLLTALFVAAMVMILAVPAFAAEATANESAPDTEVSTSTPDLTEPPADEADPTPAPTSGPVTTFEELQDAIAHANANDVIELGAYISVTPSELVLGRSDCPVTIRRTTFNACLILGNGEEGSVKVQNITFDGTGISAGCPFISTTSPTQIIENCNFINNDIYGSALSVSGDGETLISNCHFANNRGHVGAHLRVSSRKAIIENCTFTGGYASYIGSLHVCPREEALLTGCTISGNAAEVQGGGIYLEHGGGSLSIAGSKIYGNTVSGGANDIAMSFGSILSLVDDYAALVELYKPDGVIPNMWTVEGRFIEGSDIDPYHIGMVFSMTFADNEPFPPPAPSSTSVTLDKSELTLDVGETDTLTATLYPEGTSSSVQWTSSDPSIASVTESGFITAHSAGTAVITATAAVGRASASCRVNVQAVPAASYSISINANPVEGGTVSGGGQYEEGATVTVTASPNEDFRFLAWTEDDTQISTEASLTFTVSSNRTLTAIFEPIPEPVPKPTYFINTSATIGGTVSGAGEYEQGSSVTLTATPESGYLFVGWTENNEQISTDSSFTFIADRDRTLAANFVPITQPTYTINTSATVGGTASGGGEYEQGTSVTLTATPESEYLFIGWAENGELVSTDESFTFIVEQDRTLVAHFEPIPKPVYTIQVNSTQGGVVDGGGSYTEGESVTVTATSDAGYRFLRWEENGVHVSTEARFSFTAEADRTLDAVFDLIPQSTSNWTPTISYVPKGVNVKPVATSMSVKEEVKKPTLTNGKAVLTAPDDLFWGGYKTGRNNGAGTVTRADLAQLIYSMMDDESKKIYGVTHPPFRDVESGAWYETAVGAMLDTGVMFGCGNNQFCPDRTLTWGELLTVFARFTEDKPLTEYYTGEHWAKDSVNKAFTFGWLKYAEGFDPGRIVTTGEMVDLIQAVFQWNNK